MVEVNSIDEDITDSEDREIVSLCIEGKKEAYGFIVKKYMKRAYFNALSIVKNHDDALDISQEAFIQAYKAIAKFDVSRKFYTWYYQILRNLCINHLRRKSKFVDVSKFVNENGDEYYDSIELVDSNADPSVLAEQNEMTQKLWKAIGLLKPAEREILMLKEVDNCSYKEISERLEIPIGTVMSRLFNARRHLKEIFEKLI